MSRYEPLAPRCPSYCPIALRALGVAVLPEAVGLVELGAAEGVRALALRAPEQEQALGAEAARRCTSR